MRKGESGGIVLSDTNKPTEGNQPSTYTLPSDICRCHDHECPLKVGCLRYEQRESGTVHALGTMRDLESGVCYERLAEPRKQAGWKKK
jgi:hypothetical protein